MSLLHTNLQSTIATVRSVALFYGNVNGKPMIVVLLNDLVLFCTEKTCKLGLKENSGKFYP